MHLLTNIVCRDTCHNWGSCCDPSYCRDAIEKAGKAGIELETFSETMPLLGPDGCTAPPEFKPICNVHQCQIASLGHFAAPFSYFTEMYYDLREYLNEELEVETEMVERLEEKLTGTLSELLADNHQEERKKG